MPPQVGREVVDMNGVALSPDGRTAISVGDQRVCLMEVGTGREVGCLDLGFGNSCGGAALAPDGRTVAYLCWGLNGSTVRLCDLTSGKELRLIAGPQQGIYRIACSANGRVLAAAATAADQQFPILLWDTRTGKELRRFETAEQVQDLAFSPDGALLEWAGVVNPLRPEGNGVRLVEVATGRELPPPARRPCAGLRASLLPRRPDPRHRQFRQGHLPL
jgi:WD40 repeat protein